MKSRVIHLCNLFVFAYRSERMEEPIVRFPCLERLWLDDNRFTDLSTFAILAGLKRWVLGASHSSHFSHRGPPFDVHTTSPNTPENCLLLSRLYPSSLIHRGKGNRSSLMTWASSHQPTCDSPLKEYLGCYLTMNSVWINFG